jgi:uncharacterized membrane protein YkvA (DUF1232 family)
MLKKLKVWASKLKEDIYTLYLASRDPRIPFAAKVVVVITVAYAFSPIDLIPDFIPVLGYLDDLLLLPIGIWLSIKLIPAEVLSEYRQQAKERLVRKKPNYIVAFLIILLWILLALWAYNAIFSRIGA